MKTLFGFVRQPLILGAFVLSLVIVAVSYFGSHWYYGDVESVEMSEISAPAPSLSEVDRSELQGELLPPQTESTPTVSSAEGELVDDFLAELSEEEIALLATEVSEEAKRNFITRSV